MATTASSVTTVDGRSRSWSPVGTPVMGHEPKRSSANGHPDQHDARATTQGAQGREQAAGPSCPGRRAGR